MTLIECPECRREISNDAYSCPHCGKPFRPLINLGYEYRSTMEFFGLPLIHIATGVDTRTGRKRIAKGIIAMGDIAVGGVALGGVALGGVAIGGCAFGVVAIGGLAVALCFGLGGMAIGAVAIGGAALGYYSFGGGAFGAHPLGGLQQDPEAIEFFRPWLGDWVQNLRRPM